MSAPEELCTCGQKAVLLGRCFACFGGLTQTLLTSPKASSGAGSRRPGQRFAGGRFTLLELLGEGGMGAVWLADDEHLSRDGAPVQVALKFIGGDGQPDAELIRLLRKEVRAALRLSHPHLLRVHSWHEHPEEPVFYSMEFVAGLDLKRLLEQQPQTRFSCRELQPLLLQLAEALIYAHEKVGLVHRDLKPANILVTPEGQVKLADFGLARADVSDDIYATTAGGTLCYASPQQRTGAAPTVSDDIYSLGAVLYHLLTGHLPFGIDDLKKEEALPPPVHPWRVVGRSGGDRRNITPEAAGTLLRSLSYNPEDRPADVRQFWQWWNSGPPAEEARRNAGFLARAGKAVLAASLVLLLAAIVLGLAWHQGLESILEDHAPRVAKFGRIVEEAIFSVGTPSELVVNPPTEPPSPESGPPEGKKEQPSTPVMSVLQIDLVGTNRARFEIFRTSDRADSSKPLHAGPLVGGTNRHLLNVVPGSYRLEAGQGEPKTGTNWIQVHLILREGTNQCVLNFRPPKFQLFLNAPIPFYIFDAWGNRLTTLESNFFRFRGLPISQPPEQVTLPADLKLLAGTYQIVPDAAAAAALHFEKSGKEFTVSAGNPGTIGIELDRWRVPHLGSDWTNSVLMNLIPAPNEGRFLAARTETTFGQFLVFAQETKLSPASIESITSNGSTNIGLTWLTAIAGQTRDHPVVGVSWHEAKSFCDWLTTRERKYESLTKNQRYALPSSDQWTTIAGTNTFPWRDKFPPLANQGNYAGLEVIGPNWPASWNILLLDYEDPRSPRTVPVARFPVPQSEFFDLGGNAAEWCDSRYRFKPESLANWKVASKRLGTDSAGEVYQVVRGGSWFDHHDEDMLRTQTEWAERPDTRNDRIGFRIVLVEDEIGR